VAKVILTLGDKVLREVALSKERITIGRRSRNDIVIDDLAISSQHAVIVTVHNDSYLEDLNSTNGTQINGQPLKKHFLQDNDVIELADYRMRYIANSHVQTGHTHQRKAPVANGGDMSADRMRATSPKGNMQNGAAVIEILDGTNAGKTIALTKVMTTVGRPGEQVAVITRSPQGFSITHIEGKAYPVVNGHSIGTNAYLMTHGDLIDLSGARMAFLIG
jgi:hypothetical protein